MKECILLGEKEVDVGKTARNILQKYLLISFHMALSMPFREPDVIGQMLNLHYQYNSRTMFN